MRGLISREIALDVKRSGVQARIPARQGDSLVYKFIISLYCGGKGSARTMRHRRG